VLVRNTISADDAWGFTSYDRGVCRKKIEALRHGTQYEPISTRGTLLYPQPGGGSNWGGGAFDPQRNLLVTPVSQIPYFVRLLPKEQVDPEYSKRPEAGAPMQKPGLIGGTPYGVEQGPLMSPFFSPCTAPPWELLVAVDMASGEIRWKVPFGVLDKLMPVPVPLKWGTPAAGGPIITGSGLIFIGATADARIRAFDIDTGAVVWERKTPTAAQATPMTYMINGRQFVVFAAGGHSWFYSKGIDDYLLAFALPR
jgi:quinoprotein glucose dehydrogenase